jgi:hypothetical protein
LQPLKLGGKTSILVSKLCDIFAETVNGSYKLVKKLRRNLNKVFLIRPRGLVVVGDRVGPVFEGGNRCHRKGEVVSRLLNDMRSVKSCDRVQWKESEAMFGVI